MNLSLRNKHISQWALRSRQRFSVMWKTFFFMPAAYWNVAVTILFLLFLGVLATDAILFWRFTVSPERISVQSSNDELTLERSSLEAALALLKGREQRFTQAQQGIVIKDAFVLAATPSVSGTSSMPFLPSATPAR